jgi:predicted Zn-dependent peptidase
MKTVMELALARIELMKDINSNSVHWEMFKNDCMEKEKEQMLSEWKKGFKDAKYIYNQYK